MKKLDIKPLIKIIKRHILNTFFNPISKVVREPHLLHNHSNINQFPLSHAFENSVFAMNIGFLLVLIMWTTYWELPTTFGITPRVQETKHIWGIKC